MLTASLLKTGRILDFFFYIRVSDQFFILPFSSNPKSAMASKDSHYEGVSVHVGCVCHCVQGTVSGVASYLKC